MDIKHIWEGFEITLLVILGLLTLLRMQERAYLQRFQSMDFKIRVGRYPVPSALSRIHDRFRRYQPQDPSVHLDPYAPSEFILHDYGESSLACLHPYYHLSLDEAREGAQIVIYRRYRSELLTGFVILGFLTFGLAHDNLQIFSLMAFLLIGLTLLALGDRRIDKALLHLMQTAGVPGIQPKKTNGGEQEQWAMF